MKTLVMAKHAEGKHENGFDGCHARWGSDGHCPGEQVARWLNGLGDDNDAFAGNTTVGTVRDRYIKTFGHVVAVDPALAALAAEERRLSAELRIVRKQLRRAQQVKDMETPRCPHVEVSDNGRAQRRCVRDDGHEPGPHEFGSWTLRW